MPIKNHGNSFSTGRAPVRPHELLQYHHHSLSAKARNTQCCLRLLRSKNAKPCEAQCRNFAMSTISNYVQIPTWLTPFIFRSEGGKHWNLALEPQQIQMDLVRASCNGDVLQGICTTWCCEGRKILKRFHRISDFASSSSRVLNRHSVVAPSSW